MFDNGNFHWHQLFDKLNQNELLEKLFGKSITHTHTHD